MYRAPVLLNLYALSRDVRRCIWKLLNPLDKELVQCAHNQHRTLVVNRSFFILCAKYNYGELFLWGRERHFNLLPEVCFEWFCFHGNLRLVQWWVVEMKWETTRNTSWLRAVENSHFHILEYWLVTHVRKDSGVLAHCTYKAAKTNSRGVLEWCIQQGYDVKEDVVLPCAAIQAGNVEYARELIERWGCPFYASTLAVESLDTNCWEDVFQWVAPHLEASSWDLLFNEIVLDERIDVLEWIHHNNVFPRDLWIEVIQNASDYIQPELEFFSEFFKSHGYVQ